MSLISDYTPSPTPPSTPSGSVSEEEDTVKKRVVIGDILDHVKNADEVRYIETVMRQQRSVVAEPWHNLTLFEGGEANRGKLEGTMTQFAGKPNEDCDAWLRQFTVYATANHLSESRAAACFATSLTGVASDWYSITCLPHLKEGWEVLDFMKAFRQHFGIPEAQREIRWENAARARKQDVRETVSAYAVDLERLCSQAGIGEGEKIKIFIRGLAEPLQLQLIRKQSKIMTFDDALTRAKEWESSLRAVYQGDLQPKAPIRPVKPVVAAIVPARPQQPPQAFVPSVVSSVPSTPSVSSFTSRPQVPARSFGRGAPRSTPLTCYLCNTVGHIARSCPVAKEAQAAARQAIAARKAGTVGPNTAPAPVPTLTAAVTATSNVTARP